MPYVVDRGFTAISVVGTTVSVFVLGKVQPLSLPPAETGMQAGRLGAICCESLGGVAAVTFWGMLM